MVSIIIINQQKIYVKDALESTSNMLYARESALSKFRSHRSASRPGREDGATVTERRVHDALWDYVVKFREPIYERRRVSQFVFIGMRLTAQARSLNHSLKFSLQ